MGILGIVVKNFPPEFPQYPQFTGVQREKYIVLTDSLKRIEQRLFKIEKILSINNLHSPWMTFSEAADYLRIGKTKLRSMISLGRIRHSKFDKQIRILRRDCDALILYEKPFSKLTRSQKQTINELAS